MIFQFFSLINCSRINDFFGTNLITFINQSNIRFSNISSRNIFIQNSEFIFLVSSTKGGAIYCELNNFGISDSFLYNCTSVEGGGAIWDISNNFFASKLNSRNCSCTNLGSRGNFLHSQVNLHGNNFCEMLSLEKCGIRSTVSDSSISLRDGSQMLL